VAGPVRLFEVFEDMSQKIMNSIVYFAAALAVPIAFILLVIYLAHYFSKGIAEKLGTGIKIPMWTGRN